MRLRLFAVFAACAVLVGAPLQSGAGGTVVQAPESVDPGQAVAVTVVGGRVDGRIEIWGPDTGQGYSPRVSVQAAGEGAVTVAAPDDSGSYEMRYLDGAGTVLAKTPLEVAAAPIELSAPDPLGAGYDAKVLWRGPGRPGDMIQVYDPSTGRVASETPAVGGPGTLNSVMLRMPEAFGAAEIRYWSGTRHAPMRVLGVTIGNGIGYLRSPVEVAVGAEFSVEWVGPAGPDQIYQLIDPATGAVLVSLPAVDGSGPAHPVRMIAPARPGDYRVRFVNTGSGFVIADLPLDVDPK